MLEPGDELPSHPVIARAATPPPIPVQAPPATARTKTAERKSAPSKVRSSLRRRRRLPTSSIADDQRSPGRRHRGGVRGGKRDGPHRGAAALGARHPDPARARARRQRRDRAAARAPGPRHRHRDALRHADVDVQRRCPRSDRASSSGRSGDSLPPPTTAAAAGAQDRGSGQRRWVRRRCLRRARSRVRRRARRSRADSNVTSGHQRRFAHTRRQRCGRSQRAGARLGRSVAGRLRAPRAVRTAQAGQPADRRGQGRSRALRRDGDPGGARAPRSSVVDAVVDAGAPPGSGGIPQRITREPSPHTYGQNHPPHTAPPSHAQTQPIHSPPAARPVSASPISPRVPSSVHGRRRPRACPRRARRRTARRRARVVAS